MSFYPQIARENYNAKTGDYVPDWQKLAKAHKGIKISEIDLKSMQFGAYSPAYVSTNEDWRFAMQELQPNGKTVLTVMGGGDQAIAFAMSGAKSVDTFDTSYFAKVMMDIKSAAIQTMDKKQYSQFITDLHKATSIKAVDGYDLIKPVCNRQSMIAATQMAGYKIFSNGTGVRDEYMPTDEEFNAAKKIINMPMNFIWSDIRTLNAHLNQKYDIIYLSNIFEYFNNSADITNVLNNLGAHLNPNGQIMMYTSWIHTDISEVIVAAAEKCGWGKAKSHDTKNAVMLTLTRTR